MNWTYKLRNGGKILATGVWISLIAYFALILMIGFYARQKSTSSSEDYMLGVTVNESEWP